jgi:hypothetical protein
MDNKQAMLHNDIKTEMGATVYVLLPLINIGFTEV